jgi:hypothetical protein
LEPLREIFPEFEISVHDNFPKVDIAADMLWYVASGTSQVNISKVVEKIRVFFDCSTATIATNDSSNVGKDSSHVGKDSSNVDKDSSNVGSGVKTIDFPSFTHISYPPSTIFDKFGSTGDIGSIGGSIGYIGNDGNLGNNGNNGNNGNTGNDGNNGNIPLISGVSGTDEEFASPFHTTPSPCKTAFTDKEGPWRKDTRTGMSDDTIHADRRILLKRFIDSKCHNFVGAKIKSSRLFEIFKNYYDTQDLNVPFESAYNQTSFTMLMKQLSTFETKREKDGMYWTNLHVGDTPPPPIDLERSSPVTPPKPPSIRPLAAAMEATSKPFVQSDTIATNPEKTFIQIDNVDEIPPPNAMTFAELFSRE